MSAKADIASREDVSRLVHTFYGRIRAHALLGPVFERHIPTDADWEHHLEKLTDFWQTNLLGPKVYDGNPILTHQKVNQNEGGVIGMGYFLQWLGLWEATLDDLFEGPIAALARRRAVMMSRHLERRINSPF